VILDVVGQIPWRICPVIVLPGNDFHFVSRAVWKPGARDSFVAGVTVVYDLQRRRKQASPATTGVIASIAARVRLVFPILMWSRLNSCPPMNTSAVSSTATSRLPSRNHNESGTIQWSGDPARAFPSVPAGYDTPSDGLHRRHRL
jgi:hypothetical protein